MSQEIIEFQDHEFDNSVDFQDWLQWKRFAMAHWSDYNDAEYFEDVCGYWASHREVLKWVWSQAE